MSERRLGTLKRTMLSISLVMLAVLLLTASAMFSELRRVARLSTVVAERTLPLVTEAAEATRQLERLRATGDALLARSDPSERQRVATAAIELSGHPSLRHDPATEAVAKGAAARLHALAETVPGAAPVDSDVLREQIARQWEPMAAGLAAAAEDLSRRSAAAAAADVAAVEQAARRSTFVVLGALAVLVFVLCSGLYLMHRWIHGPLVTLGRRIADPALATNMTLRSVKEILDLGDRLQMFDELAARRDEPIPEAHTDPLSGLPNRLACDAMAAREFDRARRYDRPLSALALNIDHLGGINADHGTNTGDEVVRVVAARVRNLLRDADLAARLEPEKFIIFAPETPAEMAVQLAERLRLIIADQAFRFSDGRQIPVTVSIGVAELAPTDASIDALLERADAALVDAKLAGRNSVVLNV